MVSELYVYPRLHYLIITDIYIRASEYFYTCFLSTVILSPTKSITFVFSLAIVCLLSFTPSFTYYSAATPNTPTEDIDAEDIWALFRTTNEHVNQTAEAIGSGNSADALELLTQIRADLNNLNGNVTDLIFSASQAPP
jgi:hypothetical protein